MTKLSKSQILDALRCLSPQERLEIFEEFFSASWDGASRQTLDEKRFAQGRFCPHCNSKNVVRFGKTKQGTQRYCCKDCGKTFTATTGTLFSHSRRPALLRQYLECMNLHLSLRKTAKVCGISLKTSFTMRHRILDALSSANTESRLDGIVEADETFLDLSFKGNHSRGNFKLPRDPHHRGHTQTQRGHSLHKVCLITAIDRESDTLIRVSNLGVPTAGDLSDTLHASMPAGTTLCTDQASGYIALAQQESVNLVQLRGGRIKYGLYHIQNVNQLHSSLKAFLRPFHGVSTKYLPNYMTWLQAMVFRDASGRKFERASDFLETAACARTVREIAARPAIPLLSTRQLADLDGVLLRMGEKELEARKNLKRKQHAEPAVREYPAKNNTLF